MNATLAHTARLQLIRPVELAKVSSEVNHVDQPHTPTPEENLSSNSVTPVIIVDDVPDGGLDGWLTVFACSTITCVSSP